ncbi:MAG TPA: hypothetical protein VL381_09835 [Rhodocyclaceae bacterium]|jgi:hypothetical protein|nr:hypothetical protein [Rhodocyclaceae bacterium]
MEKDLWLGKISAAQRKATCWRDGKEFERVPYGKESSDWGAEQRPCGDCSVAKGQYHVPGCDVEQCPACGGQIITCDCSSSKKPKKPAKPFSKRELAIVEARKHFRWRHMGYADNGDALFEVSNGSAMLLPYLSIGVKGPRLIGGAWLNVSTIGPGQVGTVQHQCYKDLMTREEHEFFNAEEPTPETRDRFWEFERMSK